MRVGDRAVFNGKDKYRNGLNEIYGGDTCTVLETRGAPFNDCKVAFDSFPNCNHRAYHNWFYIPDECLVRTDKGEEVITE